MAPKSHGLRPSKTTKQFPKLLQLPTQPYTYDKIINWLIDSGWIAGYLGKRISPLDRAYYWDYLQTIYEIILNIPQEKVVDLFTRGVGLLINYIKVIINAQCTILNEKCYRIHKLPQRFEVSLTDEQWTRLEEEGESTYDEQFPLINGRGKNKQFSFEADPIKIKSDIDLYDTDEER